MVHADGGAMWEPGGQVVAHSDAPGGEKYPEAQDSQPLGAEM